jgi:SecD/SecF fusion protein
MSRRMLVMAAALSAIAVAQAVEPKQDGETTVEFFIAEDAAAPGLKEAVVESGNKERIYLHAKPFMTGKNIASATVGQDDRGSPAIDVAFDEAGREKLSKATGEAVKRAPGAPFKRLAVVINGKVIFAPRIVSKIGARAQISAGFSQAEAEELAKSLRKKG